MTFEERLSNLGVEVRDIKPATDEQIAEVIASTGNTDYLPAECIAREYLKAVEIIDRLETRLDNVYHDSIETIDKLTQIVDALNGKIKELSGAAHD